eukprot:SAG25_NODE_8592_length_414_cov_1.120635_1_plen_44_part_01
MCLGYSQLYAYTNLERSDIRSRAASLERVSQTEYGKPHSDMISE